MFTHMPAVSGMFGRCRRGELGVGPIDASPSRLRGEGGPRGQEGTPPKTLPQLLKQVGSEVN